MRLTKKRVLDNIDKLREIEDTLEITFPFLDPSSIEHFGRLILKEYLIDKQNK